MRTLTTHVFRAVLALAMLAAVVAAPSLGAAAFQGLQLDASITIDATQPTSTATLDVPASAFAFEPVAIAVEDKPKKSTKIVKLHVKLKNNSDTDYFVYGTATLLDADGKPIASASGKDKADDHDAADIHMKFKLSYADIDRIKDCALRFSFEKD